MVITPNDFHSEDSIGTWRLPLRDSDDNVVYFLMGYKRFLDPIR